ncbi:MAG: 50S ribosomal protein L21 [Oscillospiraceae bacterium]|nr:50S ribosomal protein L21 [Oscillospiraceae bacterium]
MYAIIGASGKQFKVEKGDFIYLDKLENNAGDELSFDVLLLGEDGNATIGTPTVAGAKVVGKVLGQVKGEKIIVYKYKSKKNERKRQGHRQPYTKVEITQVTAG